MKGVSASLDVLAGPDLNQLLAAPGGQHQAVPAAPAAKGRWSRLRGQCSSSGGEKTVRINSSLMKPFVFMLKDLLLFSTIVFVYDHQ